MLTLYPDIKPYREHSLEVDSPHVLHIEECGDPNGLPVLFLHGGPGVPCESVSRRFFNPEKYRIILFDQRGCGKSQPHASLISNTTQDLIADIERIRQFLNIDTWVLFGGSWGATLALLYAETYPEKVKALVLRGLFLCREEDFRWLYHEGANLIFPDVWKEFVKPIPKTEQSDLLSAFYRRLTGSDDLARMSAAKAWAFWEGQCATLKPSYNVLDRYCEPHTAMSFARIACHYFLNKAFLEPNQILDQAHKIKDIPGVIVHGRYDMLCPLNQAYLLNQAWPKSQLQIIRDAGHSSHESGIVDALVRVMDDLAKYTQIAG